MVTRVDIEGKSSILFDFGSSHSLFLIFVFFALIYIGTHAALNVKRANLPPLGHNIHINRGNDTYDAIVLRLGMRVDFRRLLGMIRYILRYPSRAGRFE